jgi:hypothetical protein
VIKKSEFNVKKGEFWIVFEKHLDRIRRGARAGKTTFMFYLKSEDMKLLQYCEDIESKSMELLVNRLRYLSSHGFRFIFYFSKSISESELGEIEEKPYLNI